MQKKKKVQVVILNKEKEVLILKTNEKRGRFWQNITGSVENGEDFIQGAKRELKEETGLNWDKDCEKFLDSDFSFSFEASYGGEKVLVEERIFLALLKEKRPKIILDPIEHEDMEWKKRGELSEESYKFKSSYEALTAAIKCLSLSS